MVGKKPKHRRGVLLLIVLSLLVLFVLIGMTFIVSAGQFSRLASSAARTELTGMPGPKIANASLYQIVRGTNNPYSSVGLHGLLEDLYGGDYFVGSVERAQEGLGAFQNFTFRLRRTGDVPKTELVDDYYGGCVVTFISGKASGKSARVVRWRFDPIGAEGGTDTGRLNCENIDPAPEQGDQFIVNGRPLNGTGAGFNRTTGRLDDAIDGAPVALMPNFTSYRDLKSLEEIAYGGLDESWDAVDYQNMFLARVPDRVEANLEIGQEESIQFLANTGGIIPSFHRPYLLNYYQRTAPQSLENPQTRRRLLFRPEATDHPGFTGSNPSYDALVGPWDVDNDGDGIPDSIWVDFGHDPVAGPDGRLYKPLVAPLILDMDGRVNLNAVGSLGRVDAFIENAGKYRFLGNALGDGNPLGPQQTAEALPAYLGLGYGPADINNPADSTKKLLRYRYQAENGALTQEQIAWAPNGTDIIENASTPMPGVPAQDDDDDADSLSQRLGGIPAENARLPDAYFLPDRESSLLTGYGSPPDMEGKAMPLVSPNGNMLWANAGNLLDDVDDPYEFNPLRKTSQDSPFDATDLEAILRFDASGLGDRFQQPRQNPNGQFFRSATNGLIPQFSFNPFDRRHVTTLSTHIPAPPLLNPPRWRQVDGLQRGMRAMFAAKIKRAYRNAGQELTDGEALKLAGPFVPQEIARGEKLDVNRALNVELAARIAFARDLYHLMMLFTDEDFQLPLSANGVSAARKRQLHVNRLAQWAINVVDFGDPDSVMTPFVYDPDPFGPPGPPEQETAVVWGVEHPELLLTETLAFHDRRVADLDQPQGKRKKRDGTEGDTSLDQPVPPQGSLFLELFCVRGGPPRGSEGLPRVVAEKPPEDLYIPNRARPTLRLDQMAPDNMHPVWRLAISRAQQADSNSPQSQIVNNKPVTSFEPQDLGVSLERFVWFTLGNGPRGDLPSGENAANTYVNRATYQAQPGLVGTVMEPGSYLVIGPREVTNIGLTKTHLKENEQGSTEKGKETDGSTSDQRIDLVQRIHTNASGDPYSLWRTTEFARTVVQELSQEASGGEPLSRADREAIKQKLGLAAFPTTAGPPARVTTIIANSSSGRGCNVSEPLGGYPEPDPESGRYDPPRSEPLDSQPGAPLVGNLQSTGTYPNYRTVFLQRLANPNLPYHPDTNPYRTVDWMPVDLTVFNSLDEANGSNAPEGQPFDPLDPDPLPDTQTPDPERFRFASRQRDGLQTEGQQQVPQPLNIFSASTSATQLPPKGVPIRANNDGADGTRDLAIAADVNVPHTLGWLNSAFFQPVVTSIQPTGDPKGTPNLSIQNPFGLHTRTDPSARTNLRDRRDEFYFKYPLPSGDAQDGLYSESPNILGPSLLPFPNPPIPNTPAESFRFYELTLPTLVWNNRPYVSEYELMLAPACAQSTLTHQFTLSRPFLVSAQNQTDQLSSYRGAFGHLLNFFQSSAGSTEQQQASSSQAANYFRVLDFVGVPSRFRGTQTWYDPRQVGAEYSRISRQREPGRVNLNTASRTVRNAVTGGPYDYDLGLGTAFKVDPFAEFEQSMAGGIPAEFPGKQNPERPVPRFPPSGQYTEFDAFPAEYPNPLRAAVSADLMPPGVPVGLAVDATLLRSSLQFPGQPLLAGYAEATMGNFAAFGGTPYRNRRANPYFRFRDIQKVANSVTSQSNVFAIWLTVGFFEIEPNYDSVNDPQFTRPYFVDAAHPDGYRYGIEMGSDLGRVKRHRAFFIVDRSIPVAFERGVNHNVDDAILLRRYLE